MTTTETTPTAEAPDHRYFPDHGRFPIELTGADSNGHHAAYFVKPEDADSSKYRLHLRIRNVSTGSLRLAKLDEPSADTYHLRLLFRPGLVDGRMVRKALPLATQLQQQLGTGWRWHDLETDPDTGVVSVRFSFAPAPAQPPAPPPPEGFEWKQGQSLDIRLRPFEHAPKSGAFFLKIELDYGQLPDMRDLDYEVKVREINLAVVDLSGSTFFPGKAAVSGSNTILNNGQPNSRTIVLWNAVHGSGIPFRSSDVDHESGSTITLAIRCHDKADGPIERHPTVLGTKDELKTLTATVSAKRKDDDVGRKLQSLARTFWGLFSGSGPSEAESSSSWHVMSHQDVPGWLSWEITPPPDAEQYEIGESAKGSEGAEAIDALEFRLENLETTAPDGVANVYLHFHHLPGLADHTLIVPLEKTPVVIRGQNVGIGTIPSGGATSRNLAVGGDLQVGGSVAGDLRVSGRVTDKTGDLMPVGAIIAYGGNKPPPGWLRCDGRKLFHDSLEQRRGFGPSTYSTGDYAELYERLGGKDGQPVSLPDLQSRFIVGEGQGSGLSGYGLNTRGGEERVTLGESQMPPHSHAGKTEKDGQHPHVGQHRERLELDFDSGDTSVWLVQGSGTWGSGTIANFGSEHAHKYTTNPAGGSNGRTQSHNNLPPYYALTYIIKY